MRRKTNEDTQPWSVRDSKFTMLPAETRVLDTIVEETFKKHRRCASLSMSDIADMTNLPRSTVQDQLKKLKKRELITIDKDVTPNVICINTPYKEIY
ncbi:MAG: MarR family transcriptional regulator [bacterium]|nr:MarR family transcriptional regulator [bacterium]